MKKIILMVMVLFSLNSMSQTPLSYSTIIRKDSTDAKTLYELTKNWFAQTYVSSKAVLEDQNLGKELTGKGKTAISISNLSFSGMSGYIDYIIDVQFKDDRLKFSINRFSHDPDPGFRVLYDNNMGLIIDSIPADLKSLGGKFEKSNHRRLYKAFYKRAKPICQEEFDKLSKSLDDFIQKRQLTKDNW